MAGIRSRSYAKPGRECPLSREAPVISLPKCGCSERSSEDRVFTCPVCVGAALRYWDGEGVDQYELFEYVDSQSSMRGLTRDEGCLTHISEVLRSSVGAEDLPF